MYKSVLSFPVVKETTERYSQLTKTQSYNYQSRKFVSSIALNFRTRVYTILNNARIIH